MSGFAKTLERFFLCYGIMDHDHPAGDFFWEVNQRQIDMLWRLKMTKISKGCPFDQDTAVACLAIQTVLKETVASFQPNSSFQREIVGKSAVAWHHMKCVNANCLAARLSLRQRNFLHAKATSCRHERVFGNVLQSEKSLCLSSG